MHGHKKKPRRRRSHYRCTKLRALAVAEWGRTLPHRHGATVPPPKTATRFQDQGVACDIQCPGYQPYEQALDALVDGSRKVVIALDGVTNPQNLGMIIRSVTASPCYGLLLPSKGVAEISPLVIKASAGNIFKGNILRCDSLITALRHFKNEGFDICMLSSHDVTPLAEVSKNKSMVYVLGNESDGVSDEIAKLCDQCVGIPMNNGVESLNVAVTAALIAFTAC